ncbi:MAG: DUF427 domain-containing protein [Alphaproteobacteria bacterium]|nr:DUF427 domain-containing protein [Alphaproteobacteria bacterium]
MNVQSKPEAGKYRLEVNPVKGTVTARHDGKVLAQSDAARVMLETRLDPVVYFPFEDVRATLLETSDHRTFCPFKGTATYWDVKVEDTIIKNGAWTYHNALPESRDIEDYVSFTPEALSSLEMPGPDGGKINRGNISGPTVDWIMREAWLCTSPDELTGAIARKLMEDGIAVSRISVMIWSLHPMIAGRNYVWSKRTDDVEVNTPSHDILNHPAFANSPLRHVANGLGGVRQRLQGEPEEFQFPIINDLKAEGATDYVAMPLHFSNGRINVMTLTCDHPKGFTTANLGLIFECSAVIGRLYEVFTLRDNAAALLETYLGKRTGARVLGGEIRRGDGDQIDAAILFADLRNSSRLAETMDRESYLELLNGFFETTTQIINARDGEVLKFIGDAVLAIFPANEDSRQACEQALASACEIANSLDQDKDSETGCAIGLAFGDVTYGNVGSQERLDFTVIGTAANVAARLSDLGKKLEHPVVATPEFAQSTATDMTALGQFDLHNVSTSVEAFAPA